MQRKSYLNSQRESKHAFLSTNCYARGSPFRHRPAQLAWQQYIILCLERKSDVQKLCPSKGFSQNIQLGSNKLIAQHHNANRESEWVRRITLSPIHNTPPLFAAHIQNKKQDKPI